MSPQIDAIIFDCYGVIINFSSYQDSGTLDSETVDFIKSERSRPLFVASTAETKSLEMLLLRFGLSPYFKGIYGGPISKAENIHTLLIEYDLDPTHTVLIGDSHSDWDAAKANNIQFLGYNNPQLVAAGAPILKSYSDLI
jgi:phosphoglycolate phosphatase-like HAD superfamily hydrolase